MKDSEKLSDSDLKEILANAISAYQYALYDGGVQTIIGKEDVDTFIAELEILKQRGIDGEIVLAGNAEYDANKKLPLAKYNEKKILLAALKEYLTATTFNFHYEMAVKSLKGKIYRDEIVLRAVTSSPVGVEITEVNSHTLPHPSPLGLEWEEVNSSGKTDTEYRNSTDGENEDDDLLGSEEEFDELRKKLVENISISDDKIIVNKKSKFPVSSAFWKRLRHLKSKRKRKSIVKVITETTLDVFEEQLTKYANNGYKIKYANIDTKAGNSGSGVRYYAVVQRG